MGNQVCTKGLNCDRVENQHPLDQETYRPLGPQQAPTPIKRPILSSQVSAILQQKSQLPITMSQQESENKIVRFGQQIYEGSLNQIGLPHGVGKMYKADGSLFVGIFSHGKATGQGLYILADGSNFEGELRDNIADCVKGVYRCEFKDNSFNGEGKQTGMNHLFKGRYLNGVREYGELRWWNHPGVQHLYTYYGKFDNNGLFTDEGILTEPTGKYTGSFLKGKKHGQGVYTFKNNIQYEGNYNMGIKQGQGKVTLLSNGEIIYQGGWKNNMPDGQGLRFDQKGKQQKTYYIDGINVFSVKDPSTVVV